MSTLHRVRELLARQFGVPGDALDPTTTIVSLGADSYDLIELQLTILDEFAIELPERFSPSEVTVGDIVRVIEQAREAA